MKNVLIFSIIIMGGILSSCSKNLNAKQDQSKEAQLELNSLSNQQLTDSATIENGKSLPYISSIDSKKVSLIQAIKSNAANTLEWIGPIYTKGTLAQVYSNYKIFIPANTIPGVAAAIYFCDVYSYSKKVDLPSNSVARLDSMDRFGYSNFSTLTRGVNYTQSTGPSGNTFTMTTYTIVVRYSVSGQIMNIVSPYDGNTITFAYSYLLY